jgi:hypothetical membrane protein
MMMTKNWPLTRTEPAPQVASLERWLALGGVAGPLLFVLAFTVTGMLRPGYSPVDQAISDLGIDEHAWIVNGSLVILGLSLVGLAISFSRSIRPRSPMALRAASAALLAAVGVGYAVAGIFPETNPLHWQLGAPLVYGGATLGFLLAGLLLRRSPAWRGWATVTLLASLATLVLVALTFYTFSFYEFTGGPSPVGQYGGLMERVLFIEILAWYAAVGWRLFRVTGHGGPKDAEQGTGVMALTFGAADARQRRALLGGGDPALGRRKSRTMSRNLTLVALLAAAAGFVLQMVAGVTNTPTIPPGLVVLLAAAALVALTSWRWAFLVGVAAAVFNLLAFVVVGAVDRLVDATPAIGFLGAWVMVVALIVVCVAGTLATVRANR